MSLIEELITRIYEVLPWDEDRSDSQHRVLSAAFDTSFKLNDFRESLTVILTDAIAGSEGVLEDARAAANIANGTTRKLLDRVSVLEGELHDFATWADSYPTSVWHEPDADALKAAHEALKAAGLGGIDALSAMVYRHALTHISERARAALAPQSTTAEEEAR